MKAAGPAAGPRSAAGLEDPPHGAVQLLQVGFRRGGTGLSKPCVQPQDPLGRRAMRVHVSAGRQLAMPRSALS